MQQDENRGRNVRKYVRLIAYYCVGRLPIMFFFILWRKYLLRLILMIQNWKPFFPWNKNVKIITVSPRAFFQMSQTLFILRTAMLWILRKVTNEKKCPLKEKLKLTQFYTTWIWMTWLHGKKEATFLFHSKIAGRTCTFYVH